MNTSNVKTTPYTPAMEEADIAASTELEALNGGQEDNLQENLASATLQDKEPDPEPKAKPIPRSPHDVRREEIAARFARDQEIRPFDGDMSNPENLYGDFAKVAAEPEEEPSVVGEPIVAEPVQPPPVPQAPQAKTYTIKVRGKDVTLTEDEVLERAMKVAAADSYLEDSRRLLEEAKQIKAERAGLPRQHPDGQDRTQDDELDATPPTDPQRPADDMEALATELQFGDPKDVGKKLADAIDKRAKAIAETDHVERLFNNDLSRSQKQLKDFQDAHPDLANDRIAAQVIEQNMYDLYREELLGLGLDEAQLPKSNRELANWHRFQRVHGFAVSDTTALLNKAKGRLDQWRGVSSAKQAAPLKAPARVEVNVNRDARRAAIPNQPTRSAAPPRRAFPQNDNPTGTDIVNEMRRARGQPVAN